MVREWYEMVRPDRLKQHKAFSFNGLRVVRNGLN